VPTALWIAITVLLGCTQALQVGLLGAMNRLRGPAEAAWVSILGTVTGLGLTLALVTIFGRSLALPAAFNVPAVPGVIALAAAATLAFAAQGIPAYLGLAGLLAVPYLLAASFLAPRIGIGLFLAAIIAGQLIGGVVLDHVGAFGASPRPVDLPRLLGVVALLVGVVLIRGRR
jgi:transporter family-2 protein